MIDIHQNATLSVSFEGDRSILLVTAVNHGFDGKSSGLAVWITKELCSCAANCLR